MKLRFVTSIILIIVSTCVIYSQQKDRTYQHGGIIFNKDEANKVVFAFLPSWIYANNTEVTIRYDLLTHLAIFTYEADIDGNLTPPQAWPWLDVFEKASENNVKMIMTITNFNSDEIHLLFTDSQRRANFFNNITDTVAQYGFNGIVIDFENVNLSDDRQFAFANFMRLLKQEMDIFPAFELSVALPANGYLGWDFKGISEYCNYVFVMGYDYYGSWSSTTGPSAPLTGTTFYLKKDIDEYYKDVTPDKIILGVPYYGNIWDVHSGEPYVSAIHFDGINQVNNWQESLTYEDIVNNYSYYEKMFDYVSNTSWMRYRENDTTWKQIWYDDTTSLGLKYDWAIERNFKGIGIWALGYDNGRDELWNLIYNKFYEPTSVREEKYIYNGFVLSRNYPNPFNSSTIIKYNLQTAGYISLKIYDMLGREIYDLVNGYKQAGEHSVEFRVKSEELASGVYFYTMIINGGVLTRKMIYLK